MLGTGGDDTGLPKTTVLPDELATGDTVVGVPPTSPTSPSAPGAARDRHDRGVGPRRRQRHRERHPSRLALADGSASTSWPTECYSQQVPGRQERRGTDHHALGRIVRVSHVESLNAPYQIEVFASADATPPDGSRRMGSRSATRRSPNAGGVVETTVSTPASHVLVWLKELGRDSGCSTANPYRGRLGEISFTA